MAVAPLQRRAAPNVEIALPTKKLGRVLYGVGAQKTGTTWLSGLLRADDRFRCSPLLKEIHYFDSLYCGTELLNRARERLFSKTSGRDLDPEQLTHLLKNRARPAAAKTLGPEEKMRQRRLDLLLGPVNDDWYVRLLRGTKRHEYSVDITPNYALVGVEGFRHMMRLAEVSKFIFIMRNPAARAWSAVLHSAYKRRNREKALERIRNQTVEELFIQCTTDPAISLRTDYLKTIRDLHEAGGAEHTLLALYDDLSEQPEAFVGAVYGHLGVLMRPNPQQEARYRVPSNVSPKMPIPEALRRRLSEHYRPMLQEINARYRRIPLPWFE